MNNSCWLGNIIALLLAILIAGCGESDSGDGNRQPVASGESSPAKTEGGYIVGRVVGQDGKPISVAEDIGINVFGVSEAGEKISYSPSVKPDGTYKQRLVPGTYRIGRSTVKVKFGEHTFNFQLTPKGSQWNKDREAGDGIEQDFIWNMTGQRTEDKPDPNNATHWYGMSIGMRMNGWRDDLKKAPIVPPAGTTLVFTLTPLTKQVNGEEGKTLTIERAFPLKDGSSGSDLNDLPPASYEITGVAKLPDGTTKPLHLQGAGDYPNHKSSAKAELYMDNILGGMGKPPIAWVLAE